MMSRISRLRLAYLLCAAALFAGLSAAAPPHSQTISFEEYYRAVQAEYARYGIGYEVYEQNDRFVFTQAVLDARLSEIRNTLSHSSVSYNRDFVPLEERHVGASQTAP